MKELKKKPNPPKAGRKSSATKTKAGNASLARLVVGMSGADKAPPEAPKRKKRTKTSLYIQRLANEPEWTGPWEDEDGKRDASRLPPSDFDLPADLK